MKITLTTTQNQKNNINKNLTVIDLGKCEDLLREEYNISDDALLYMKKIDIIQEGMKIPKMEYDIYSRLNGNKLIKLNLTVCKSSQIHLYIPVSITESLDILNSSSGYYNDICYTASSDSGTDITLEDRKNEFFDGNKTVCQEDCDFSEYDYNTQKAKCSCKVKESSEYFDDMKINITKMYENFIDIKHIINIQIMKCYKILFTKEGLIQNIASYLIISIIIFHLIVFILFYTTKKKVLDNKIKDIKFGIINWELVEAKEEEKKTKKIIKVPTKRLKFQNNNIINNMNRIYNKKENVIKTFNPKRSYKSKNKNNPSKKKKNKIKIKVSNNNNINNLMISKKEDNTKSIIFKEMNNEEIINKSKEIMEYDDMERNDLSYNLALKHDNRTFCEYYISLLKTKQFFIFSFFNNNDYNSRIIKIDLFFISFTIFYTVNALFFNDNTMHKIYIDKGSFDLVYQLPQIVYSSLISTILNVLLKLLALSEGNILNFKKNKDKKNLDERVTRLNNILKIKFILFFIISFLFLAVFWYYLSMFCAVYRNTQSHLIKDTLMSFALSLIYPFFIYLFPGMCRIPSLFNRKNERKNLYKISKFFQMI